MAGSAGEPAGIAGVRAEGHQESCRHLSGRCGAWNMANGRHSSQVQSRAVVSAPFDEALQSLTIEDFERSVLLPQGRFADFLKAGDKERAQMLERLTSTDRFARIGAAVAQRRSQLLAELKAEEHAWGLADFMPDETRAELRTEHNTLESEAAALRSRGEELSATIAWFEASAIAAQRLARLTEEAAVAEHAWAQLGEIRERLREFERAAPALQLLERIEANDREADEIEARHSEVSARIANIGQEQSVVVAGLEDAEAALRAAGECACRARTATPARA